MFRSQSSSQESNRRWIIYAFIVLLAILLYFLFPRSLLHPFRCQTLETVPANYQASNGFFIDNQVIVIGPKAEVDNIIGTTEKPGSADVQVTLAEGCDLSYLNYRKFEQTAPAPTIQAKKPINSLYLNPNLTEEQRKSMVIRLYEIPAGAGSTEEVISRINEAGKGLVVADPNYLTGLLGTGPGSCGEPYSGGGSPYSGGGSPYSGGGSPFAGPGIPNTDVSTQVMRQWAFGSQGINLSTSLSTTGHGAYVGVFDTSPFREAVTPTQRISNALPSALSLPNRNALGPVIMSNHGLFVAALIHAIAPQSEIELIRVLDDNGCGNLWEITQALQSFISRRSARTGRLDHVVINLSLGVQIPDAEHRTTDIESATETASLFPVDWEQLDDDIEAFEDTINNAYQLGATIIAASGNDSAPTSENPTLPAQDMQQPASYENVIGVAATNKDGNRSCYSNKGDVAAPGGNGGVSPLDADETCVARASTYTMLPGPGDITSTPAPSPCTDADLANCDFGVISMLITTDQNRRWITAFGLWSGTSFSAPQVSGLAALAVEKTGGNQQQVYCLILEGTSQLTLPASTSRDDSVERGIIDVTKTLTDPTVLSRCPARP